MASALLSAFGNGASATFTPPTGSPETVDRVMFRSAEFLDEAPVSDTMPFVGKEITLRCSRSATTAQRGWRVTVTGEPDAVGKTYRVSFRAKLRDPSPDGLDLFVLEDVTP